MLSLILYGRNDSYGYNLHKRAAISLNCMAEMLTAPDDEIIFVDYNTPDDFPTFPEAIQDTLTERAKALLRILRVRPSQHEPFRLRTGLVALEPIARNVALRRSNPANRWILSTNTDMVFVPQRGASLSEIVANLPDAYYPLPRFEVPETLWESADRLDPKRTIEAFGTWGRAFHLNEIVLSADPTVKYDAPGDFQLALRSDLWQMDGFHEGMLLGWHVDSNLAKRLALLPRRAGEVLDEVFGYHCDHTRQVTPAHRPRAAENDLQVFFADVTSAQLPEQSESWGLAGQYVEEITVDATSRRYVEALQAATPEALAGPTPLLHYEFTHHNRIDYSVDHVMPFIADAFASYRRDTHLAWFGSKRTLLDRFARAWKTMGFSEKILVPADAQWLASGLPAGCVLAPTEMMTMSADVFLFDWGRRDEVLEEDWDFRSDAAVRGVLRGLRQSVREERRRFAAGIGRPRRFVAINAVNNDAERIFHDLVGAARTPIATRIRQGYVSDLFQPQEMMPAFNAGAASRKISGEIVAQPGAAGCLFYVLPMFLDRGNYRLRLEFAAFDEVDPQLAQTGLGIDVISSSCLLYDRAVTMGELLDGALSFEFAIPQSAGGADDWPETEFLMRTLGRVGIRIRRAVLEQLESSDIDASSTTFDFLPLLTVGPAGMYATAPAPVLERTNDRGSVAVQSKSGVADFLVYGPHIWLLPGRYAATFECWAPAATEQRGVEARIEVVSAFGHHIFAEQFIDFTERGIVSGVAWQRVTGVLQFDIRTGAPPQVEGLLEVRIWSEGGDFALAALDVRRIGDPGADETRVERLFGGKLDSAREAIARRVRIAYVEHLPPQDVLWLSHVGPAGRRSSHEIEAVPGIFGVVAHGPYLWLLPGHYEVSFELSVDPSDPGAGDIRLEVVSDLGNTVLATDIVAAPHRRGRFGSLPGRRRKRLSRALAFTISTDAPAAQSGLLEFRVWSPGTISLTLTALRVREIDSAVGSLPALDPLFGNRVDPIREAVATRVRQAYVNRTEPPDVLELLQVGSAGRKIAHTIQASRGECGVLAHGPYIWLLPGRYEASFELFAERAGSGSYIELEVVTDQGNQVLASQLVEPHWKGRRFERMVGPRRGKLRFALPFEIATDAPPAQNGLLEFRVWSPGTIPFKLTALRIRQVAVPHTDAVVTAPSSP